MWFWLRFRKEKAAAVGSRKEATSRRRRMRVSRLQTQAIPGSKSAADVPGELPPPPPGRYFHPLCGS